MHIGKARTAGVLPRLDGIGLETKACVEKQGRGVFVDNRDAHLRQAVLYKTQMEHVGDKFPAKTLSSMGRGNKHIADKDPLLRRQAIQTGKADYLAMERDDGQLFPGLSQFIKLGDCKWMPSFGIDAQ